MGQMGRFPSNFPFSPSTWAFWADWLEWMGRKTAQAVKKQDLKCAVKFGYPGRSGGVIATSASSWATPGGYQLLKCIAIHQNELKNRPRLDSGRRHE